MGKHPILHYINEIKNKLGFSRTMTASGADVVDAVNGLSWQIGDVARPAIVAVTSLDQLKTLLLSEAATMLQKQVLSKLFCFIINFNDSNFVYSAGYSGYLHIVAADSGVVQAFSMELTSQVGDIVVVSYNFGTWTVNGITNQINRKAKISSHNYNDRTVSQLFSAICVDALNETSGNDDVIIIYGKIPGRASFNTVITRYSDSLCYGMGTFGIDLYTFAYDSGTLYLKVATATYIENT